MRDKMNISVNGQSRVPPGFRFHPTEEELLQYYLRKKVANEKIDLDVIFEVDLNKLEPWDIQERCKIGSTPQNDWYFFSHKDKKYPTGTRTNRATAAGFWKATGRDKVIHSNSKRIGMRKTLVFYKGRAPHGHKSDWIMHEYRLYDSSSNVANNDPHVTTSGMNGELAQEEGWVVCRIFKKKNYHKTLDSHINTSTLTMEAHSSMLDSSSDQDHDHDPYDHDHQGTLEEIFQFMGTKPQITKNNSTSSSSFHHKSMKLPSLESPNNSIQVQTPTVTYQQPLHQENGVVVANSVFNSDSGGLGPDWAALDRFVATHLNGQPTEMMTLASIFSSSAPYDHPDEHDHDHIELPPLRSSSSTSSGIIEMYQAAATLDDYGGNEIDL